VHALGGEDMRLDALQQRPQRHAARADLIGQRRQADLDAFARIALRLAVQRLVLAVFLEQHHREQAGAEPAARRRVEGRRRLGDLLAVATAHLLADVLDELPPARDRLQRLGDDLAHLAQTRAAAACAGRRPGQHDALARHVVGDGLARGRTLAHEGRDLRGLRDHRLGREFVLGGGRLEIRESEFHLFDQTVRALRAHAVDLALEPGDLERLRGDERRVAGRLGATDGQMKRPRSRRLA